MRTDYFSGKEEITLKKRIKITSCMLILATAACISGCSGKESKKEGNIDLGMQAINEASYEEAAEYFNKSIEAGKDLQLAYRGLGMTYMNMGEYEAAKEAFTQALQNGSFFVNDLEIDISCYLASAYYKLGDYDGAIEIYTNVLELSKKNDDVYYLRGVVNLEAGYYEAAIKDFDKTIELDSKNYDRYINIYKALALADHKEEGVAYLEKCSGLLSEKQQFEKGRICYYMEDYNGAVSALESLSESGDNRATLYLGKAYEALGDMNYAASLYEKYIQTDETNGEVYNQLGLCKLNMEEYETALNCFQKGIATGDGEVMQELLFNEASAYEYISDFSTAKTKFSEYLAKYPNDETARRELEFLETR